MIGKPAYYCVIQYCPDRGREEAANVGILVFVPDEQRTLARVASVPQRARQFFSLKREETARVALAAASLVNLVNSNSFKLANLQELERFVATRANDIQLTAPRLMKVADTDNDLKELYCELVESEAPAREMVLAVERQVISPVLSSTFARLKLLGKVQEPGRIRVPVLDRDLDIPYAYQNGVLNLVKPQLFVGGVKSGNRAMQLAAEGSLLHRHPDDGERRLIVVAGEGSTAAAEIHAAQLLGEFGVRFVPQSEVDQFACEVENEAH